MAINTARNLSSHYGSLGVSIRRLSSGLRIGTAADDAAGLAVREIMRSDIASLGQGVRNANDAISMIQVADGALQVIDEKLIRMKELATQAATGTYTADQRAIINDEFQAMMAEINRIAKSTEFNGIKILDGNPITDHNTTNNTGKIKVHFGSNNSSLEDYYYVNLESSSINNLFSIDSSSVTPIPLETEYMQLTEVMRIDSGIPSASRNGLVAVQNSVGHIFLAWTSNFQTDGGALSGYARFIDQNGNILTDEIKLIDNNFGAEFDINAIPNGSSIYVTWTGREEPDTDPDFGIYGQNILYNISKDNLEHINTFTTNRQGNSDATILSNGDKIIVWDSDQQDGDGYGVYGQRINNSGLVGTEFIINDATLGSQNYPRIASFNNDNFMVVWTGEDSTGQGVFAKLYNSNGINLSGEFKVNNQETSSEIVSNIEKLSNGNILVYWESQNYPDSVDIYGKIYDQNGSIVKDDFLINQSTSGINRDATVNATEDGFFASYSSDHTGSDTIYGTVFDNNGLRTSNESHIPFNNPSGSLYLGNNRIMMTGISGTEVNVQIFNMPTNTELIIDCEWAPQ